MFHLLPSDAGSNFSAWQRLLIKSPEKQKYQKEFIAAIDGGKETLPAYLRRELRLDRSLPIVPLHRKLSPGEVATPSLELEQELWEHWKETLPIYPREASLPIFWCVAYIQWIEDGSLGDDLRSALIRARNIKDSKKLLDAETRSGLYNLGGLPEVRGRVSVFSNCPLARAWWRCRYSEEISDFLGGGITFHEAHSALYWKKRNGEYSNSIWDDFTRIPLGRITLLSDPKLRAAIVAYLVSPECQISTKSDYAAFAQNLARRSRSYSISLLGWDKLEGLVRGAAESV